MVLMAEESAHVTGPMLCTGERIEQLTSSLSKEIFAVFFLGFGRLKRGRAFFLIGSCNQFTSLQYLAY